MEDFPALNTRKSTINKGEESDSYFQILNPGNSTNKKANAKTTTPGQKTFKASHTTIDKDKAEKIKVRARRLSDGNKSVKKQQLDSPKRSKKKLDLNRVDSNLVVDIRKFGSSKRNMANISEVLGEANSTLHTDEQVNFNMNMPASKPSTPLTIQGQGSMVVDNEISLRLQHSKDDHDQGFLPEQNSNVRGQIQPINCRMSNAEMLQVLLQSMNEHKEEIKAEFKLDMQQRDIKVGTIESTLNIQSDTIQSLQDKNVSLTTDINSLKDEISQLKHQVSNLSNATIKHDNIIDELQDRNESRDQREMKNNLIIRGIAEKKHENCLQTAANFFKNTMKITDTVQIIRANRLGKGTDRPLLIILKSPGEKGKVFKNVKNLKDVRNDNNKKYQVRNHYTAKGNAHETQINHLMWKNKSKRSTAEHLEMTVKNGHIHINDVLFKSPITAPTVKSVLQAKQEDRTRWSKVKTVAGNRVSKGDCSFQGYSVVTNKIDVIRDAYMKLRELHGDARHIVCCWRLAGKNFAALQNYVEDQEFGCGPHLLNMLTSAEIYNRAVFVVRYYGGVHLGPSRYQAFVEAAQSAITQDPYNRFSKENQTPWPKTTTSTTVTLDIPEQTTPLQDPPPQQELGAEGIQTNQRIQGRQLSGPLKQPSFTLQPKAGNYSQLEQELRNNYYTHSSTKSPDDWEGKMQFHEGNSSLQQVTSQMVSLTSHLQQTVGTV